MFELEVYDNGLLVGDFDFPVLPEVGNKFVLNGYAVKITAVRTSANGSDAAIDIIYI